MAAVGDAQFLVSRVLQSPDASSQPAWPLLLLPAEEEERALTNPGPARLAWSPLFPKSPPVTPGPPPQGPTPGGSGESPGPHPAVPPAVT